MGVCTLIPVDKLIPEWDFSYFVKLNGYEFPADGPKNNMSNYHQNRSRSQIIDSKYILELYGLIKIQEIHFIKYITNPQETFRTVNEFILEIKYFDTFTGRTVTKIVSTVDKNFSKFMVYLYNKFRSDYFADLFIFAKNGKCSYCQVSRANTLDHFLPKEKFPLLALTPWNLIPCCSECNLSIGEKNSDLNSRPLIHPYTLNKDLSLTITFTEQNNHYIVDSSYKDNPLLKNHIEAANIEKNGINFQFLKYLI